MTQIFLCDECHQIRRSTHACTRACKPRLTVHRKYQATKEVRKVSLAASSRLICSFTVIECTSSDTISKMAMRYERPSSVKLASVKHELYHPRLPTLRRMDMDNTTHKLPTEHSRTTTACSRGTQNTGQKHTPMRCFTREFVDSL